MSTFDEPVTLDDGRVGYWMAVHPQGHDRIDENRHPVKARDTRLWVTDPEGVSTKEGHNKRKYYCVDCAIALGAGDPPKRYF